MRFDLGRTFHAKPFEMVCAKLNMEQKLDC